MHLSPRNQSKNAAGELRRGGIMLAGEGNYPQITVSDD